MAKSDKDIVLISEDPDFTDRMGAILGKQAGFSVTRCNASIIGMNGKATELARSSELIIFKASPNAVDEQQALKALVASGGNARILAVSDSSVPFGVAHDLLRAGVSEIVPDTIEDAELAKVVTRLSMPRRLTLTAQDQREGQVIVISKARGGIGATTLAVNLADQLCGKKKLFGKSESRKVVLVDLDLQFGAVSGFLDLQPNNALYSMARERIEPDSVFLQQSIETTSSGLAVLTAPAGFMPLNALQPVQVGTLIRRLRQTYDFVVIDLPHAMVDWLTPVLEVANHVLIVSGTSVPFVQQTRRLIDFFKEQNPSIHIEVVVGQEKKPLLRSRRHAEAAKALETEFRHWLPSDPKAAETAMDRGCPLSQAASGSPLTKEIAHIAADLLKAASETNANKDSNADRPGRR
jgi:pilus assembly protein CpaE